MLGSTFSKPSRLSMLAFSELVRLREVVFCILAVSVTDTFYGDHIADMHGPRIGRSLGPGLPQRIVDMGDRCGRGISATICWPAGFPTAASLGASIFSMRSSAEQADRAAPASNRVEFLRTD